MGEMPFSMTYGAEAVIPVEVSLSSSKVAGFTQGHNDECMVGIWMPWESGETW